MAQKPTDKGGLPKMIWRMPFKTFETKLAFYKAGETALILIP